MTQNSYISKSIDDTYQIAKDIVDNLKGGEIIALNGELGAGKTVLTKGIAQHLGIKDVVNSPTFVLMKIYSAQNSKISTLVHVDAYRLGVDAQIDSLGLDEFIGKKNNLIVIEWFDYIKNTFDEKVIKINIKHINEHEREISIS